MCPALFRGTAVVLFALLTTPILAIDGLESVDVGSSPDVTAGKVHPLLLTMYDRPDDVAKAWVFFVDKGCSTQTEFRAAIADVEAKYNPRAKQRRAMRGLNQFRDGALFDEHDIPVVQSYIDLVASTGAEVKVVSSWVNAISVKATLSQCEAIAGLSCVKKLQPVARRAKLTPPDPLVSETDAEETPETMPVHGSLDYGNSQSQLQQMNLIALHEAGYTGQGVIVGILDTGFKLTHEAYNYPGKPLNVVAAYDFLNDDPNVGVESGDAPNQHEHGTKTLSCLAAYKPGSMIGGSFDASYILAKTEDTESEVPAEEDNYVAGLQFIEANGADMATASLGYIDWYSQSDLDGLTAVTTIACNILTANGVHHCNAAGNEYHDSNPSTSSIIAPADGFQVITCGAVTSTGSISYFSSDGPTADGRVKPEILARGSGAAVVSSSSDTSYTTADGTSFATPLTASAVACLVQAKPYWTVDQMREHIFETATDYVANGTYDPTYVRGYGIIDAYAAYDTCSDAGVVQLDREKYACDGVLEILVNDCGLNSNGSAVEYVSVRVRSSQESEGELLVLTEADPDAAEFLGTIPLDVVDGPGVLLVADKSVITVEYIDADDGVGGTDVLVTEQATVDCVVPAISDVAAEDVEARSATVTFTASEPVKGIVHYGTSCGALSSTTSNSSYANDVSVALTGLADNSVYFYSVEAEDEAGNTVADDNGGNCYSFVTPETPDYFTEDFNDGDSNDLENWSIKFSPNGSMDFYDACAETIDDGLFPSDPTGGTSITLGDDEYATITLTRGLSVSLYGVSYSTIYPCSNGYITFGQGDTEYDESPSEHFSLPRVAGLFDDLDPRDGGTISWKQFADRVAITWDDIRELNGFSGNTFQIVLYFNGDIELNYLDMVASDGLAGLSAGNGTPAGFEQNDLTALGNCGPKPPRAIDVDATTAISTLVTIALEADDDGLPETPGAMTYVVESLPAAGTLRTMKSDPITTVPYTLTGNSNSVQYKPKPGYEGTDSFEFKANDGGSAPAGGDSNVATVSITVGGAEWNPVAINVNVLLAVNEARDVSLAGTDPNSDPLVYVIETLPARGLLSDPGAGWITSVPYELVNGGSVVTYVPPCGESFSVADTFTYWVEDATASSNAATVAVVVQAGGPRVVYRFDLDNDPGWSREGLWQFGTPSGGGSHHSDPSSGYTGDNVLGYNLMGDYQNNKSTVYSLTTTPINCSNLSEVELRFYRWLGVERFDGATVEVSADGVDWSVIWENPADENVDEAAWSLQSYDISAVADGEESVQIRWTMGPTDLSTSFPGWNIDDVRIRALVPLVDADFNGDGLVTLDDFSLMEVCLEGPAVERSPACMCIDLDDDGDVDLSDFAAFQMAME